MLERVIFFEQIYLVFQVEYLFVEVLLGLFQGLLQSELLANNLIVPLFVSRQFLLRFFHVALRLILKFFTILLTPVSFIVQVDN